MHERYPSPPAYIPPMPADLYSDDEDEEEEDEVLELERPVGREVVCDPCGDIERIAVTSSVELQSVYEQGFEEWKPKQPWAYDDVTTRSSIRIAFRQSNFLVFEFLFFFEVGVKAFWLMITVGRLMIPRVDNTPP